MTSPNIETQLKKIPIPGALHAIRRTFKTAEVFVVGGAVRDALLRRKSGDIDYLVRNVSYPRLVSYLKKSGSAELVGQHFGVIKYTPRGTKTNYDIALPRREHSLHMSGGYRDFAVQSDPKLPVTEDLQRRDFTINAMAWDVFREKLIDPENGLADVLSRRIRTVGEPRTRFQEDYTRLLRGLRFAVELNFQVEEKTWRTLKQMIGRLKDSVLPREAVAAELVKMFDRAPLAAIDSLENSGALRVLMPEAHAMKSIMQPVRHHREGSVWNHGRLSVEAFQQEEFKKRFPKFRPDAELYFATWIHDIAKSVTARPKSPHYLNHEYVGASMAKRIAQRLKLSSAGGAIDPQRLSWLLQHHLLRLQIKELTLEDIEHYFCNPNHPGEKLLALNFADAWASFPVKGGHDLRDIDRLLAKVAIVRQRGFRGSRPFVLVTGNDIMQHLKRASGPEIGKILSLVRYQQLEGKLKNRTEALSYLKEYSSSQARKKI